MTAASPRLALATVYAEGLAGRLAFGMVSFALPLYAAALGLSLTQIGVIVSTRTLLVLPFKPVSGWLADRIGLRRVYLGGIAVRALSAVVLLVAGDFAALLAVRALQGASSAARDVASLGVIAREAKDRVGTHFGRYAAAKQIGTVTGAAAAGLAVAAAGGRHEVAAYRPLFMLVLAMSVLPLAVAAVGLREDGARPARAARERAAPGDWRRSLAELGGPASVGMMVATSAYMVHGLYPVLATQYAGLSEAQAGIVYSASGLAFAGAVPAFGWLVDRHGRTLGMALRSLCNIGSSVLYVALPSLPGVAAARVVDDSGKAAFQPAWASVVAQIATADPRRLGRRLSTLDTAATVGEAIGPALATLLWQTGGILLLFGVRIVLSAAAELAAVRVFGESRRKVRRAREAVA
jgi:MFS family permease